MDGFDVLTIGDEDFEHQSITAEGNLCLDCPDPALCMAEAECCAGGLAR